MISLIFSTYNGERALRRTPLSLCKVTPPKTGVEFLIVDNGSTDATRDLLDEARAYLDFTLLDQPLRGKNRALNLAVSVAKGDLFVFTDDDVIPDPENRAGPVRARSRAGPDRASARHRSSVAVEMLSSRETASTDALSGGNNLATALSLNACPHLATSFFRYRSWVSDSIEATTILTLGALPDALPAMRGWAGSPDFLLVVADRALERKPRTVVECSSRVSTIVLARCLQINGTGHAYSLEHDPAYAERTRKLLASYRLSNWATVIDAPLTNAANGQPWYSLDGFPATADPIDLLVVNGPPADTSPLARYPALPQLFGQLSSRAEIIMDDTSRPGEQEIIRRWLTAYPLLNATPMPCEKGCVIIENREPAEA